jgi:hypothetical protein
MQWKRDPLYFEVPIAEIATEPDQAPCVLTGSDDHDHFVTVAIRDYPIH